LTPIRSTQVFPRPWLWLFPPGYLVHLIDERFFGIGTAAWATAHMDVYLTNDAWLIINIVWFLGLSALTWLIARGSLPDWAALVLATHFAIHSLTRVWGSAAFPGWSPGVVSGVLIGLPWSVAMFYRGTRELEPRRIALAVALGVLSLQPVWDFFMLPILSPRPLAG